ncbi:MAG: exo-alpha-sialidase [Anaerolineae bacterium]|nr:exo-alpha-sialidase [Anaerolineae bacterium]
MIALVLPPRIRAGFVILLFFIVSWLIAQPSLSFAQDPTLEWSRPIPLSGALGGSRYPSLVADDQGQLLLIWTVSAKDGTTIFASRFDGQVWQRPVDVLLGSAKAGAQLDGRDRVHLLLSRGENQILTEAEFETADTARAWTNGLPVNSNPGATGADFIYDTNDVLYTVWLQKLAACDTCYSVGFKKHAKDMAPELTYRVLADSVSSPQQRTQLRRAPDGTLYVMWDAAAKDDLRDGIQLSRSADDGATWSHQVAHFASSDSDLRQPLLFIDSANNLVLVYNFGVRDETYYSISTDRGTTWSEPTPIPGLYANKLADADDYFAHVTDSAGITHLIASGRSSPRQQTSGLYHLTWDGSSWGNFQELYNKGPVPEFPFVTLANGNRLHVVFSTHDPSPVSGDVLNSHQVWYTSSLTDAPAATRVPLPTFTLTPTATATPEATETPAPSPTATTPPTDPVQTNPPVENVVSIPPILIVIAPVALILFGVIVWASVFRKRS